MADIIPRATTGTLADPQQRRRQDPSVIFAQLLAPYTITSTFSDAFRAIYAARHTIQRYAGTDGLRRLADAEEQIEAATDAEYALANIPPPEQIAAALAEIDQAITTAGTLAQRRYLIGQMLIGRSLKASSDSADYICLVSGKLDEVAPYCGYGPPSSVPLSAVARAMDQLIMEDRSDAPDYGRFPPISEVVEKCSRAHYQLCDDRRALQRLEDARGTLQQIVDVIGGDVSDAPIAAGDIEVPEGDYPF